MIASDPVGPWVDLIFRMGATLGVSVGAGWLLYASAKSFRGDMPRGIAAIVAAAFGLVGIGAIWL